MRGSPIPTRPCRSRCSGGSGWSERGRRTSGSSSVLDEVGGLRPSADSALILAVELPPALEAIRLRHVPDAAREDLPAHATLLYPFAEPGSIDAIVLGWIASIVGRHPTWTLTLAGFGRWPDAVYATVEPDGPVRALQAE